MTRVILHVGPHKTGTTALQQGFVALRDVLGAAGIHYPAEWQDHLHGHHALVRDLMQDAPGTLTRLRALAERTGAAGQALLLSSENLDGLDGPALARLAAGLQGHAVEVVYFARQWSGLLPSAWQEEVKQGGQVTYPEFLVAHLADPAASSLLNYGIVLGRYAGAFGRDAIRLVSYDGAIEAGELLGFFLARILGAAIDTPAPAARVNRALPPVDVEIIRAVNAMARRSGGSLPGGVWPMRLLYDLSARRHPAVQTLRAALAAHVVELLLPAGLPARGPIETSTLERFGPALAGGETALFDRPQAIAGLHVAGTHWMDPAVPPAFTQLCEAMCGRHGELAAAA